MGTSRPTDGLWTMTKGAYEESVRRLEVAIRRRGGNPRQLFDRLREQDGVFVDHVARYMARGAIDSPIHHQLARYVLGRNFFGLEEWSANWGVSLSEKQVHQVAGFPWGEDVLCSPCPFVKGRMVKDTHFAFLGLASFGGKSLTIARLRDLISPHPDWPAALYYAFVYKKSCQLRWHLMPIEPVPGSQGRSHEDQLKVLPEDYEVPFAVEEVLKLVLYHRKGGVYFYGAPHTADINRWAKCRDLGSGPGNHLHALVGLRGDSGIAIADYWEVGPTIYLAASRKLPAMV